MRRILEPLFGNARIKETLAADIVQNTYAHAYILSGAKGSGKHTAARLLMAAMDCEHRADDGMPLPCGACTNCHRILRDISSDVMVLRRGERATLGVEQIRAVKETLFIPPNDGERKFYVIEDAHTMTPQAQNALLLSLEEPPPFAVFFLLTEDALSLLETIRSRAPVLPMERFSPDEVMRWLDTREPLACKRDPSRVRAAAMLSDGSLGQALSLLTADAEKSEPLRERALALWLWEAILAPKGAPYLAELSAKLPKSRDSLRESLQMFSAAARDVLARKKGETHGIFLAGDEGFLSKAQKLPVARLLSFYQTAADSIERLTANAPMQPLMTLFLLRCRKR